MRADQYLVDCGLAASRSQAQRLIAAGARWRAPSGWRALNKSDDLPTGAQVQLLDAAEARYVSRGGLKLEGALTDTSVDVTGWRCLDVGQSTGGFTDCLLQHGAAHVTGIDVGRGQLHSRLAADPRVRALEGVNARQLESSGLVGDEPCFDLVVADLSFISLTLVLTQLATLVVTEGHLLLLVKPQFELQPHQIGKGGLVKDPALYELVAERLRRACATQSLHVCQWLPSRIVGGDGNREFFIHAVPRGSAAHLTSIPYPSSK